MLVMIISQQHSVSCPSTERPLAHHPLYTDDKMNSTTRICDFIPKKKEKCFSVYLTFCSNLQ